MQKPTGKVIFADTYENWRAWGYSAWLALIIAIVLASVIVATSLEGVASKWPTRMCTSGQAVGPVGQRKCWTQQEAEKIAVNIGSITRAEVTRGAGIPIFIMMCLPLVTLVVRAWVFPYIAKRGKGRVN